MGASIMNNRVIRIGVFLISMGLASGSLAQPAKTKNMRFLGAPITTGKPGDQVAAARFLTQATFGPTLATIQAAQNQTYDAWFAAQAAVAPRYYSPSVIDDKDNWMKYWW